MVLSHCITHHHRYFLRRFNGFFEVGRGWSSSRAAQGVRWLESICNPVTNAAATQLVDDRAGTPPNLMLHMMQWPAARPRVLQTIFLKIEYEIHGGKVSSDEIDKDWHSHHPYVRLATCKNAIRCTGVRKRVPSRMRSMIVDLHNIMNLMTYPPSPVEWMNACLLTPHQWRCGHRWRRRNEARRG